MEQFKRAQVVMLCSKTLSSIILSDTDKKLKLNGRDNFFSGYYQHLYIISDDEIKEGDWILRNDEICQALYIGDKLSKSWKKIIATTDTSLNWIEHDDTVPYPKGVQYRLPQPSQQFIEKYIEEYNKDNVITNVLVEYEGIEWLDRPLEHFPKINPKDNTITIKKVKNSWDEKELDFEFNKLLGDLLINKRNKDLINNPNSNKISEYITNWIKENL